MNVFANKVIEYFRVLDSALENLSKKQEQKITGLPSWALSYRDIYIGMCDKDNLFIIKAIPNENLTQDNLIISYPQNDLELAELCAPWEVSFSLSSCPKDCSLILGDAILQNAENRFASPLNYTKGLYAIITRNRFGETFNTEIAKRDAFDMWNIAFNNLPKAVSFVKEAQEVFTRFKCLIRRKSFLERRIHRYINSYRSLILPQHKKCFYDYKIFLAGEYRKADFILEREKGMPALLIELENPSFKLFKQNGELTAQANHAKNQIAEWIKFIEQNPEQNAKGEMDFLNGPKQRLVIMGKGMEHLKKMVNSRYSDTIMWTYDLFIQEAISRLNSIVNEQCKILGIEYPRKFN